MEANQFNEMDIYSDMNFDTLDLFGDCNFAMDFGGFGFPDPGNDVLAGAFVSLTPVESAASDSAHWPNSEIADQVPAVSFDETCTSTVCLPQAESTVSADNHGPLVLATGQVSQLEESQGSLLDATDDSKGQRKRNWDDSILVFGANPETKVVHRKRKAFSPNRRKEVARNRLIGACVQCKLRRGPVS